MSPTRACILRPSAVIFRTFSLFQAMLFLSSWVSLGLTSAMFAQPRSSRVQEHESRRRKLVVPHLACQISTHLPSMTDSLRGKTTKSRDVIGSEE